VGVVLVVGGGVVVVVVGGGGGLTGGWGSAGGCFRKYATGFGGAYINGQKFSCPYGVLGWHP
jgi:hypothetical protein